MAAEMATVCHSYITDYIGDLCCVTNCLAKSICFVICTRRIVYTADSMVYCKSPCKLKFQGWWDSRVSARDEFTQQRIEIELKTH